MLPKYQLYLSRGLKPLCSKLLTGNLDFGIKWSRQERIAILSNERVNSTCVRLNSIVCLESGIYFFISGNGHEGIFQIVMVRGVW